MKHMKFNLRLLGCLFAMVIAAQSCSDNDEPIQNDNQTLEYSEVQRSSEIDKASASIDDIAIEVYEIQEAAEDSRAPADFNLPDCVTVTLIAEQGFRELTIDFGTEGCVVNGNTLKGLIVLSWERNPEAQTVSISKSLIDFYYNAIQLEGQRSIFKELSNENGNPQFTRTGSLTVTWPNGLQATRNGQKVREWVEGALNGVWSDNVFEVTGFWSTTFVNGNSHNYEVIIPLRREVICAYFVSGSIDVERTNFSGVFDYGDGDCDNMATFTFDDGTVVAITLN